MSLLDSAFFLSSIVASGKWFRPFVPMQKRRVLPFSCIRSKWLSSSSLPRPELESLVSPLMSCFALHRHPLDTTRSCRTLLQTWLSPVFLHLISLDLSDVSVGMSLGFSAFGFSWCPHSRELAVSFFVDYVCLLVKSPMFVLFRDFGSCHASSLLFQRGSLREALLFCS